MKTDKIIININNLNEIDDYKKIGITNFLFAIEKFSIGYNTFSLDELKSLDVNVFLLINRMMDNKTVDSFKEIVPKLNFVKGIFFEDLAVYNILADSNIPLIWNQVQMGTSLLSINYWLNKCASAVLSNSITESEIINIINNVTKPVVFNVLGKNMAMYSRRALLTNFNKYKNLKDKNKVLLKESIKGNTFLAKENEYGTILFDFLYFNYYSILKELNDNNIKYYYINNLDTDPKEIINFIKTGLMPNSYLGFLNKKTIFKVGDKSDRTS